MDHNKPMEIPYKFHISVFEKYLLQPISPVLKRLNSMLFFSFLFIIGSRVITYGSKGKATHLSQERYAVIPIAIR